MSVCLSREFCLCLSPPPIDVQYCKPKCLSPPPLEVCKMVNLFLCPYVPMSPLFLCLFVPSLFVCPLLFASEANLPPPPQFHPSFGSQIPTHPPSTSPGFSCFLTYLVILPFRADSRRAVQFFFSSFGSKIPPLNALPG